MLQGRSAVVHQTMKWWLKDTKTRGFFVFCVISRANSICLSLTSPPLSRIVPPGSNYRSCIHSRVCALCPGCVIFSSRRGPNIGVQGGVLGTVIERRSARHLYWVPGTRDFKSPQHHARAATDARRGTMTYWAETDARHA